MRSQFSWSPATGEGVLEAAIVYVAVLFAGGYLIRYLTRNLTAGIEKPGETQEQVKNAGMYIGWLERFLVVTAILVQWPSMVGLILTGKSIAISGVERAIRRVLCDRHIAECWTSCAGRFGFGKALVRDNIVEVNKLFRVFGKGGQSGL